MELLKAVQQLRLLAELLQHVGQQLVRNGAFARHVPVEVRLQFGQRYFRPALPRVDAGMVKIQHGRVGRQGVGLAEGGFGLGEAVGRKERVSQRPPGGARLHIQQRRGRSVLERTCWGWSRTSRMRAAWSAACACLPASPYSPRRREADVQLGDLNPSDRLVIRAFGRAVAHAANKASNCSEDRMAAARLPSLTQ